MAKEAVETVVEDVETPAETEKMDESSQPNVVSDSRNKEQQRQQQQRERPEESAADEDSGLEVGAATEDEEDAMAKSQSSLEFSVAKINGKRVCDCARVCVREGGR